MLPLAFDAEPRRRFICRFVPSRLAGVVKASLLVTRDAHEALGAFVHLDVPAHEPGRILVSDESGTVLLSAVWPPSAEGSAAR